MASTETPAPISANSALTVRIGALAVAVAALLGAARWAWTLEDKVDDVAGSLARLVEFVESSAETFVIIGEVDTWIGELRMANPELTIPDMPRLMRR